MLTYSYGIYACPALSSVHLEVMDRLFEVIDIIRGQSSLEQAVQDAADQHRETEGSCLHGPEFHRTFRNPFTRGVPDVFGSSPCA